MAKSESNPQKTEESYLLHFIGEMVHGLGHQVAEIRNIASYFVRRKKSLNRREREMILRIGAAADELANSLRLMRLLDDKAQAVACNFVSDILQPAFSFGRMQRGARIRLGSGVRELQRIEAKPGLARQALIFLFSTVRPEIIRCDAGHRDDVTIHLAIWHSNAKLDEESLDSVFWLFNKSGAEVDSDYRLSAEALQITLHYQPAA